MTIGENDIVDEGCSTVTSLGFGKSGSPSSYPTASKRRMSEKEGSYLEIFAGTKQNIKRAVKEIQKDLADQCTTRVIEKDAISKLSKEQRKTVMDLALNHDVTINLEQPVGRISVRGDPEDVLDVATYIHEILNQKLEEEHTRGIEELISKNIQWYYYEDEDLEAYDTSVNSQIENAYGAGQSSVIVLIDDARCEVVFKDMKETCLEDGEERVVVRKEIGKGKYLWLRAYKNEKMTEQTKKRTKWRKEGRKAGREGGREECNCGASLFVHQIQSANLGLQFGKLQF